ncbi:MAG: TRAP transporter TatT component family protein, partial [Burkholderiaceae bacterium]
MLLMQARLIQAVANRIADGCTRLMARSLVAVLVFTPTLAQATALPGDIKTLSCVAGKLGELVLWSDPRPRLRAWAISSLVKDAYGIRAFEAEQLELTDPEAAKSKRAEAIRLLKIAKEAGWDHLKSIALNPRAAASDELALAYWTSAAWGALIALDRDDLDALADWPKAKALADWVRQQQADFGEGAAKMLAASFEWSSPGGDKAQAKLW